MEQEVSVKAEPVWHFSQKHMEKYDWEAESEEDEVQHITVEPELPFLPSQSVKDELSFGDDTEDQMALQHDVSTGECTYNADSNKMNRLTCGTDPKREGFYCLNVPTVPRRLNIAVIPHSPKRRLKCEVCGKQFSQIGHLKDHTRSHTGERPYECQDCGKSFRQKSHLKRHFRTHGGDRPHRCDDCGRTFIEKDHLKKHLQVHTGEKPFECTDCGRCFSRKANLNTHLITHAGTTLYNCNTCGRYFPKLSGLNIHRIYAHSAENLQCIQPEEETSNFPI